MSRTPWRPLFPGGASNSSSGVGSLLLGAGLQLVCISPASPMPFRRKARPREESAEQEELEQPTERDQIQRRPPS